MSTENQDQEPNRWEEVKLLEEKEKKREKVYIDRWDEEEEHQIPTANKTEAEIEKKIQIKSPGKPEEIQVDEFICESHDDPRFAELRELFIKSFEEFYKEIEKQLKLNSEKNLTTWLDETFDEVQAEIIDKRIRCFVLSEKNEKTLLGFFTAKEEGENSVYVGQCAIKASAKRKGYGGRLLEHLRTVYPEGTRYWGLCRRANIPATHFYLKLGAKFMDDEQIAKKYDYDPELYTGFWFVDEQPISNVRSNMIFQPRSKSPSLSGEQNQTEPIEEQEKTKKKKRKKSCCKIC